jgi:DNA-binding protein H-NS
MEVTNDVTAYFHQISEHCNHEILELQEQLEMEKAAFREEQADEVVMKADEIEELSNIFIDCIHEQRKTLRQQLLKKRSRPYTVDDLGDADPMREPSMHENVNMGPD